MRNVNVNLVNIYCTICTFMSMAQFGTVIVQDFILAHV